MADPVGLPNGGVSPIPVTPQVQAVAGAAAAPAQSGHGAGPLGIPGPAIPNIPMTAQTANVAGSGIIPPGQGLGPNASIADLEAYVRKTYGYMSGFLDIPEVRNVLLNGARLGWGSEELYGALSATNWWKTTSASARQWAQLTSEDPASAQAQAQQNAASISDIAKTHGLNLSGAQIGQLAIQAAQYGWSNDQTLDAILKNVTWGQVAPGSMTADVDKVKAIAGQFLVPVADSTAQDWALRIARGELTEDGVKSILQTQAKARWSYMAPLIDQGVAPADFFAPIRDTIANTLEIGSNQIDMTSPQYLKMLEVRDPKTGELRAATLNEAMLSARKDPRWAATKNAQDLTASMVSGLQKSFGQS